MHIGIVRAHSAVVVTIAPGSWPRSQQIYLLAEMYGLAF